MRMRTAGLLSLMLLAAACGRSGSDSATTTTSTTVSSATTTTSTTVSSTTAEDTSATQGGVHDLSGVFQFTDPGVAVDAEGNCGGTGANADVVAGAEVVVKDAAGAVLATSELERGLGTAGQLCRFAFEVDGIPASASYSIEVAGRPGFTFTAAQLNELGWDVYLEL